MGPGGPTLPGPPVPPGGPLLPCGPGRPVGPCGPSGPANQQILLSVNQSSTILRGLSIVQADHLISRYIFLH